jgi:phosphatidylglycerophosphatase A
MSTKTDRKSPGDSAAQDAPGESSANGNAPRTTVADVPPNPELALWIGTVGGLGYVQHAPGTLGSIVGVAIYGAFCFYYPASISPNSTHELLIRAFWAGVSIFPIALLIAFVGVWASDRVAKRFREKDPQYVVIDEVSGQLFTYIFSLALGNWKYLLLGFILFRAFDIWKPFPARQAESLPGGWGIMADDWIAAAYAALGLWIARAVGL